MGISYTAEMECWRVAKRPPAVTADRLGDFTDGKPPDAVLQTQEGYNISLNNSHQVSGIGIKYILQHILLGKQESISIVLTFPIHRCFHKNSSNY